MRTALPILLFASLFFYSAPYSTASEINTKTLGPEGGEITTPSGFSATFPKGALENPTLITLEVSSQPPPPIRSGIPSGITIRLSTDTPQQFEQFQLPVTLTAPIKNPPPNSIIVGYSLNPNGALDAHIEGGGAANQPTTQFFTMIPLTLTWIFAQL